MDRLNCGAELSFLSESSQVKGGGSGSGSGAQAIIKLIQTLFECGNFALLEDLQYSSQVLL